MQPKAKAALHEIYEAEGWEAAESAFDLFVATYDAKYPKAVECLAKDREALLVFYDFPAERRRHIRMTNPIESTFATVRLRPVTPKFAPLAGQPGEPLAAIPAGPASSGAESYALVASQAGQRNALFQGRPQEFKPLEGQDTLGLREETVPSPGTLLWHREDGGSMSSQADEGFIGQSRQIASKKSRQIPDLPHSR